MNTNDTYTETLEFYKDEVKWPPSISDWVGIFILSVLTFLANVGGLGGGGLFTPLLLIQFKLSIFECIPLVNVFGFIAALTRFLTNFKQKHPFKPWKVCLDYEIIQLSMPILYLGTLVGVNIGTNLSDIQLTVIFELIIILCTYKIAQKGIHMYKKESLEKQLKKKYIDLKQTNSINTVINNDINNNENPELELNLLTQNGHNLQQLQPTQTLSEELKAIIEVEKKHFPLYRTLNFLMTLIFLFATSILLGNKYQKEKLVDPVISYLAFALFVIYCVASTYYNARLLKRIHFIKKRDGYAYDSSDFKFDNNTGMVKLIGMCFFAGCLGGVVGIAGGILLIPIFFQLGVLPVVVAGTNQYFAMISTLSVSSQFIYMGVLNYEYTIFLGIFVIIASYAGNAYTTKIIKLTGRQSVITLMLVAVLIALSMAIPLKYLLI